MKKYNYFLWIILSAFAIVSCSKDNDADEEVWQKPDIAEDRGAAPGAEYDIKAGEKYLNLVYFVPGDMQPVEDWHWRLSGIMNHVHQFYGDNLKKYYDADINFKMARNTANPDYVKILLIKGSKPAASYKSAPHVQTEVMAYFRAHPDEKYSHHSLVLMPSFDGAPEGVAYGSDVANIPNEFMGIVSCDQSVDFNIKYFRYSALRQLYLQPLGKVLTTTGLAMGLTYNAPAAGAVYGSLTTAGTSDYITNPEKIRLTKGDLQFLVYNELFNRTVDYNDIAEVVVKSVKITTENDNLKVVCRFSSTIEPVAFMVYNDFFRAVDENGNFSEEKEHMNEGNSMVKDAILNGATDIADLGGDDYEATVEIPSAGIPEYCRTALSGQDCAKAELRFRIVHANGTCTPSLMYAKCGKYYEDNLLYPDRFRYFYFLEPSGFFIPYREESDIPESKNTWKVQKFSPAEGYPGYVIDNNKTTTWKPRFTDEFHPSVTIGRVDGGYWSGIKGFKIHPGTADDRAKKITLSITYWDGAKWTSKIVVEKFMLKGAGKYYYYIDEAVTYLFDFTVTVEETSGVITTSLAEIGLY